MVSTELPNGPIYLPKGSEETMPAPEWSCFLSIADSPLNSVPVNDLDEEMLKELMAGNRGLTLLDLKKRRECSSLTTTSGECYNEWETPAVPPVVADADDHLSGMT